MRETTPLLTLGHRDDALPRAKQVRRVERGKRLRVTCGYAAWIVGEILERRGYEYRRVVMVPDKLGAGVGTHTIIEVKQKRGWTLYDPLYGVKPLINGEPTTVTRYTRDKNPSKFVKFKTLDLPPWYEKWRGVGMVEDGPGLYHHHARRADELRQFSSGWYRWIPKEKFHKRFYN